MKIISPDILHKTDVGSVELGLDSADGVRRAFSNIVDAVAAECPGARIQGVRVEEMVERGVEIIIGLNQDEQFGPVVMFGLGGNLTEVLDDVSFRVLPITADDAQSMISEIQGRPLLEGYRGQAAVRDELLVDLLMKASRLGQDLGHSLDSVDLNPIVVWGDEHRVLDFKLQTRPESEPRPVTGPNTAFLETFFEARAVALVGASSTPGKIGNAVLDSLTQHDYDGKVYPVNPGREEVMGLRAYPDLASTPADTDLSVPPVARKE